MMKKIGYRIFAIVYYVCCIVPRNPHKVFAVMTHDPSDGSNVGVVLRALQARGGYHIHVLKKDERDTVTRQKKRWNMIRFFLVHPYHMATASFVLQDNVFLPMAYIHFPKSVKVVQLWHGTGTIKKFGQSVNEGELAKLEKAADATITHLIVNGHATKDIYKEAFGVEDEQVYELGLPRTDVLFCEDHCTELQESFYEQYPQLRGNRLVLYAPTFRDNEVEEPTLGLEVESLIRRLPEDMYLGLKLHPYVAKRFAGVQVCEELRHRVYDFSQEKDTNQLLIVADVLITDYSSIIFDYCVLRKPMIFYAYDFEEFRTNQRGFYDQYESFVPGHVVYTQEELLEDLIADQYDFSRLDSFVQEQYRYLDGGATKRLIQTIFDQV